MNKKQVQVYRPEKTSNELARESEVQIEKRYRLELRKRFQKEEQINKSLAESAQCLTNESTFESIRSLTEDSVKPGTEEIFERVLHELLEELSELHKKSPSMYLVNQQDGKIVLPLGPESIYTPPDYVGEDGKLHQSKPILHPAISVPLTMLRYEQGRKSQAIAKAPNEASIEHLRGPEQMIENAKVLLQNQGIEIKSLPDGEKATIEVGRERLDDIMQSPNYSFHRSHMFGSLLAKKILDLTHSKGQVDITGATLRKGTKEQWYEVNLRWQP